MDDPGGLKFVKLEMKAGWELYSLELKEINEL